MGRTERKLLQLSYLKKAEKALDKYHEYVKKINKSLDDKFGYNSVFITDNFADGLVFCFEDDNNALVSQELLEKVLKCETIEEVNEVLSPYSV